jgi:hypothetical protein
MNRFLTNLRAWKARYIRLAAALKMFDVYIGEPSYRHGEGEWVGVYTNEWSRDHSSFWGAYRRLMEIGEGHEKGR